MSYIRHSVCCWQCGRCILFWRFKDTVLLSQVTWTKCVWHNSNPHPVMNSTGCTINLAPISVLHMKGITMNATHVCLYNFLPAKWEPRNMLLLLLYLTYLFLVPFQSICVWKSAASCVSYCWKPECNVQFGTRPAACVGSAGFKSQPSRLTILLKVLVVNSLLAVWALCALWCKQDEIELFLGTCGCQPLVIEAWLLPQPREWGTCRGRIYTVAGFLQSSLVFSCQYHSTSTLYAFIHLPQTLHDLSRWHCC